MRTKKRNALFGRYPSCDLLNNALRYLLRNNGPDWEHAMEEIITAIHKADGYIHADIADEVESFNERYWEKYRDA